MFRFVALLALLVASHAWAHLGQGCYTGYAYHSDTGELAYTARYRPADGEGSRTSWQVIYRDPAGETIGRKSVSFAHHPFVPEFTLQVLRSGDMAGINRTPDGAWRMVEQKGSSGERRVETFDIHEQMAADVGLHPFVRAHFDTLMAGETVPFKLVLAPRQSVLDMRIERIDDTRIDGQQAVRFRARIDMFLVSWFTQDLVLAYDPESRRLLRYRGLSNMQDDQGEPFPVRMRYRRGDPPAGTGDDRVCQN